MKKAIYFILILSSFNCRNDINQNNVNYEDIHKKELKIPNKVDSIFSLKRLFKKSVNTDYMKFGEILKFDIYKDTIYSFYENKILKVDTAYLSLNQLSFNPSLFTKSNKIINYDYIFDIKNSKNAYQLVNYNSLINYNKKSKLTDNVYLTDNIVFSTLKENYNILCDYRKATLLDNDLVVLDEINYDFIDNFFIESDKSLFYCEDYSDSLIEFSVVDNKIILRKRKPLSEISGIKNFDNFNVELITDDYIVGAYYDDYSSIFFINRKNYRLEGEIFIGEEFKYSKKKSDEFYAPNFQIIHRNNKYYFIGLNNDNGLVIGAIGSVL